MCKVIQKERDAFAYGRDRRVDHDVPCVGWLEGRRHSRTVLDLPGSRARIRPYRIPPLANVDRCAQIYLNEWHAEPFALHDPPCPSAIEPIGRNECGDGDEPCFGEESRRFGHTTDVFSAVLRRAAEIRAEAEPNVIAVKYERLFALIEQLALEGVASVDLHDRERPVIQTTAPL